MAEKFVDGLLAFSKRRPLFSYVTGCYAASGAVHSYGFLTAKDTTYERMYPDGDVEEIDFPVWVQREQHVQLFTTAPLSLPLEALRGTFFMLFRLKTGRGV